MSEQQVRDVVLLWVKKLVGNAYLALSIALLAACTYSCTEEARYSQLTILPPSLDEEAKYELMQFRSSLSKQGKVVIGAHYMWSVSDQHDPDHTVVWGDSLVLGRFAADDASDLEAREVFFYAHSLGPGGRGGGVNLEGYELDGVPSPIHDDQGTTFLVWISRPRLEFAKEQCLWTVAAMGVETVVHVSELPVACPTDYLTVGMEDGNLIVLAFRTNDDHDSVLQRVSLATLENHRVESVDVQTVNLLSKGGPSSFGNLVRTSDGLVVVWRAHGGWDVDEDVDPTIQVTHCEPDATQCTSAEAFSNNMSIYPLSDPAIGIIDGDTLLVLAENHEQGVEAIVGRRISLKNLSPETDVFTLAVPAKASDLSVLETGGEGFGLLWEEYRDGIASVQLQQFDGAAAPVGPVCRPLDRWAVSEKPLAVSTSGAALGFFAAVQDADTAEAPGVQPIVWTELPGGTDSFCAPF